MILHILQLEFEKTKISYFKLQQESEKQAKELHDYKKNLRELPQLLDSIKPIRSPLKSLSTNATKTSDAKHSVTLFDDDDLFNSQLKDADMNLSKDSDQSLFIEDSFDYDTIKSPTLNKSRKNRSIKKAKRNITTDQNASDCSIILGTPMKIIKYPKRSKLSACYTISDMKSKSCLSLKNNQRKSSSSNNSKLINASNFNDSDETLCFAAPKSEFLNKENTDHVSVDDILKELENNEVNNPKKQKLEDSFDCIPEKKSTSPDYAYKREAVRKKSERLKLQGWACADCEKYYTKYHHLSDEELQKRMDMCSKHRNKFNPNILTPKGFWDVDFPPTQESVKFDA
ncbi:hypothetical protein CBL_00866 [Carabus blaptoides fortunei]